MMWFFVAYISIGLWLLMPGIVYAWETVDEHWAYKVVGLTAAVIVWPLALMDLD